MNRIWRDVIGAWLLFGFLLVPPTLAAEPTTEPLLRLETGMHTAVINRIASDRDGRWAVTASDDKTARVWEIATGRLLQVLSPPQDIKEEGKLRAVALSPDGVVVALGGWTGLDWDNKASIYLFDRASGRLVHRISEVPGAVNHLAYSPDGSWLAASLTHNGVHVFNVKSGIKIGSDKDYGDQSYSVHFSPDGRRLLTTSLDGQLRLYEVASGKLRPLKNVSPGGGKTPYAARFSPDGRTIAVGFHDSTIVQVLDADTLTEVVRPSTSGVDNGYLHSVAWSADGHYLVAGGQWDVNKDRQGLPAQYTLRRWPVGQWSRYKDVPLARDTLVDLVPLPGGGLLFASGAPSWGVLDPAGQVLRRLDPQTANFQNQQDQLRLSSDGRRVRFGFEEWGKEAHVFEFAAHVLGVDDPGLASALISAPGVVVSDWKGRTDPKLNGRLLPLEPYELSNCLAIMSNGQHFVLGTSWGLLLYDRNGRQLWRYPVPTDTNIVNLSADGRFVVAGYADGTIRWHRFTDGKEVLAFFPHADRQRWIAWTPEGYFDASPGAEELIGYHLNRGRDQAGEFVQARQLWEIFYQPGLIAHRLDADGDARVAEMVKQRGDIRQLLTVAPPELELLSREQVESDGTYSLKLRVKQMGQGTGRVVLRVDGQELSGRWLAPALTPGGVVELPLELAEGKRTVTAELVDARGIASKSVRTNVRVHRQGSAEPATLHVLAVGVTNYRDRAMAQGVAFAAKDAQDIAKALGQGGKGVYQQVRPRVLWDNQATRDDIRKAGQEMALQVRPQDAVIIYLAGHGISIDGDYYFLPWETRYTSHAALKEQGLSADMLRGILAAIPASKVLVLLDTCSSGRFSLVPGRGLDDKASIDRLQRITGRALIAAAADEKMALEGEGGHGVFTHTVLRALAGAAQSNNDPFIDVGELAAYVDRQLPEITKRKWNYEQFPVLETRGSSFPVVVGPAR